MSEILRNFSMRNLQLAGLFVLLCGNVLSHATAFFSIVTSSGIVIGADGKVREARNGCRDTAYRNGTMRKIFLLQHKLAFGSVGLERAKTPDRKRILYDFPRWATSIDKQLGRDATVNQLLTVIKDEAPGAFSPWANGQLSQYACNQQNPVVQYVVAGYSGGVPSIYVVNLQFDWGHNIVNNGPDPMLMYPLQSEPVDSGARGLGFVHAMSEVCAAKQDAYQRAESEFPVERGQYCTGSYSRLTLKEAARVVRMLLQIEAEIHPDDVGLPFTIVTIPRTGRGRIKRYTAPISRSSGPPEQ